MKKYLLILPLILILIVVFVPGSLLSAQPAELITNGDFETGDLSGWSAIGSVAVNDSGNWVASVGLETPPNDSYITQEIGSVIGVITDSHNFNYRVKPLTAIWDSINITISLYNGLSHLGTVGDYYDPGELTAGSWTSVTHNFSDWWFDKYGTSIPDHDRIIVKAYNYRGDASDCIVYFDDFSLASPQSVPQSSSQEMTVWVRTMPMTCWQVWINDDNNFQFIFWYPYKDNNWVRIYDMEGNMVFEVDLLLNDPNLIVDLPDGFYMVKTFHHDELLQEFLIGKP